MSERRYDVRALVVGKVPVHQRVNMREIQTGDMICMTWQDDDDIERIGVAQVIDTNEPMTMHWWETTARKNYINGAFWPVFKRHDTGTLYRAKKKRHENDGIWTDTLSEQKRFEQIIQYGDIFTKVVPPKAGKKQKDTGRRIKNSVKKRACWLGHVDWKIPGHDDNCECVE